MKTNKETSVQKQLMITK